MSSNALSIMKSYERDQRWQDKRQAADRDLNGRINAAYKDRCMDMYYTANPHVKNTYRDNSHSFWHKMQSDSPILSDSAAPLPPDALAVLPMGDPLPEKTELNYDALRRTCTAYNRRDLPAYANLPVHLFPEVLHRALKNARPFAASGKNAMPVLTMVHLESIGDRLQVTTTNLDCAYRTAIPYRGHAVSLCVNIRNLCDYMDMNIDGARLIQYDTALTFIFPDNRATFKGIVSSEFPNPQTHNADDLIGTIPDSSAFKTAVQRMIAATATAARWGSDMLKCVEFATNDYSLGLRASDGTQLASGSVKLTRDHLGFERILLHRDGLAALLKALPKEPTEITVYANPTHVYFVVDADEFILARTAGELPQPEKHYPEMWNCEVTTDLDELIANVKRIRPYCGDNPSIVLDVKLNQIKLTATSLEKGESTVCIDTWGAIAVDPMSWELDNSKLYKALSEFAKVGKKPTTKKSKKGVTTTTTGDPRRVTIKATADMTALSSGDQFMVIMNMKKETE